MVGRPPRVREGYQGDAQQILRLVEAIKLDTKCPKSWRATAIKQATDLARLLLKHP